MCVVSMVIDHYADKWKEQDYFKPTWPYTPSPGLPGVPVDPYKTFPMTFETNPVTRQEFEALKRDLEEMKKLVVRAKEYDRKNNEPDCEKAEKMAIVEAVAKLVGVDVKDLFGTTKEA